MVVSTVAFIKLTAKESLRPYAHGFHLNSPNNVGTPAPTDSMSGMFGYKVCVGTFSDLAQPTYNRMFTEETN
jgi:hypothetical protein